MLTTFALLQVIANPLRVPKKYQLYRIPSLFLVCIGQHVSLSKLISDLFLYHYVEQEDIMMLDADNDYDDGSMSDENCEEDGKHMITFFKGYQSYIWK